MTDEREALIEELTAARADFLVALDALEAVRPSGSALLGAWSAREIIAHVGYWTGHAVEVIHAVETGAAAELDAGSPSVDEVNATVARVARQTDLKTARKREAASVEALHERLRALDPALLSEPMSDGTTLAAGIREDGSAHYRRHAVDLRAAAAGR